MCQLALSQIKTHTLLPSSSSFWVAPLQKARGYPAYRTPVHETQPCPSEFGRVQSVATDGLRTLRSSFSSICSTRRSGSPSSLKLCRFGCTTLLHQHSSKKPTTQSSLSSASLISPSRLLFFSHIAGREVIQCLALCQRTPILAKVARIVSPDTRSLVSPSSKLTSAAISIVQRLLSLPNSLGLWWSISRKASIPFSSKVR